jgi:glutaconate CoA-transferase subunit A
MGMAQDMEYPELENKLMTPEEAVKRYIKNRSQIALGGFTISRNPMAIVYEIIRQKLKDLHIVYSNGQA